MKDLPVHQATLEAYMADAYEGRIPEYIVLSPHGTKFPAKEIMSASAYKIRTQQLNFLVHLTEFIRGGCLYYMCELCGHAELNNKYVRLHILLNHPDKTGWKIERNVVHISEKIAAQKAIIDEYEREALDKVVWLESELFQLRQRCDHRHSNGESAIELHQHPCVAQYPVCKVCGIRVARTKA